MIVNETATTHATTEVAADHGEASIWQSPDTWILVSFLIFIALFAKFIAPKLGKGLDSRANTIRDQLEQASRLRAEAEAMLAQYQQEQQALLKEAEKIVEIAKKDAAELRITAAEELKLAVERRSQQAEEKIARAEAEAVAEIRTRIIESATDRARDMLAERVQHQSEEQMVARALDAIKQQIH